MLEADGAVVGSATSMSPAWVVVKLWKLVPASARLPGNVSVGGPVGGVGDDEVGAVTLAGSFNEFPEVQAAARQMAAITAAHFRILDIVLGWILARKSAGKPLRPSTWRWRPRPCDA